MGFGEGVDQPPAVLALHHHSDQVDLAGILVVGEGVLIVLRLAGLGRGVRWELLPLTQDPAHLRVLPAGQGMKKVGLDQLSETGEVTGPQGAENRPEPPAWRLKYEASFGALKTGRLPSWYQPS